MIVSSVAPPMSCARFVRTVTRARTLQLDAVLGDGAERATSCDFVGSGQSITLG